MPVTPGAMRCEMREALAPVETGGLSGERCGKTTTARRILGYALSAVTPVRALRTNVRLRRIGLHKLLPVQCTLLTRILYLLPALGSLCRRKTPQLAVFTTLQGVFSPQLLTRIELLLLLRLQIGLGLGVRHVCLGLCIRHVCLGLRVRHVWLCLRGRRELTLAFCTQLLSLNVPLLLDVPLLLLNIAIDHRRRLLALGRGKI